MENKFKGEKAKLSLQTDKFEIGIVGCGVMGRNLLLNMADKGFSAAGYDKDEEKIEALHKDAEHRDICGTIDIKIFVNMLQTPRAVMMLVPAGGPVDSVINELLLYLEPGDLIIDGGNSYFKDTDLRARNLSKKGIQFLGVGISGGEEGARHGPSIMPGGPKDAYQRVKNIFESAAAKVNGEPCVTWLGPGSSGHFVKMVHNGIEYGVMQLISETYHLMKEGLGLNDDELSEVYELWNKGELSGYLIEITSQIFAKQDKKTGKRLIDEILDVAKQKGTGMWTTQSAMELQVPIPTIDQAVAMRDLSVYANERKQADEIYRNSKRNLNTDRETFIEELQHALYVAMIFTYAQGFSLLRVASEKYKYHINIEEVARIWRGGCIIRTALLDDICAAYRENQNLSNLLLDLKISQKIKKYETGLRHVVCKAAESRIPVPGLMASLGYLDGYSSAWLPANLIQAQRDYFGAHTYERIDAKGTFHMEWQKE